MHLTKLFVNKAAYAGDGIQKCIYWDDDLKGFGLRVYPSGDKSYVVKYRVDGRQRLLVVGSVSEVPLSEAREQARDIKHGARRGHDELESRRKRRDGETMADLCGHYIQEHAPKKRSGSEDIRRIKQIILPRWRNLKIAAITRSDIAKLHAELTREGAGKRGKGTPYQANRVLALLSKMLTLAKQWGYLEEAHPNPATGVQKNPETKRDRFMSMEELPRFIEALKQEPNIYVRCALMLYPLTGLRRTELLAAKWEDLDHVSGQLRIPQTKSNRPHVVHLSREALEIFSSIPRVEDNPFIFVGAVRGGRLINIQKPWRRIVKRMQLFGDPQKPLRIHDLRHTFATWLAVNGTSPILIRQMLNHSDIRTTMRYVHSEEQSIKDAMQAHSSRVTSTANIKSLIQSVPNEDKPTHLRLVANS